MTISHYNNGGIPQALFEEVTKHFESGDYTQVQHSTVITRTENGLEFIGEATGDLNEADGLEIQWSDNDGSEFEPGTIHKPQY